MILFRLDFNGIHSCIYSITSYLTRTHLVTQEDLYNTTLPFNSFRTEVEIRAAFENSDQTLGVQLLHISRRPIKAYENSKWKLRKIRLFWEENMSWESGHSLLTWIIAYSLKFTFCTKMYWPGLLVNNIDSSKVWCPE
jgi:hypothetical protein